MKKSNIVFRVKRNLRSIWQYNMWKILTQAGCTFPFYQVNWETRILNAEWRHDFPSFSNSHRGLARLAEYACVRGLSL